MQKWLWIAFGLLLTTPLVHAEARWCDITGVGPTDKFYYPPIGRAAHVEGVALVQVTYSPDGSVSAVDRISGPMILTRYMAWQIQQWHLQTNATGKDSCQSLVVAIFQLDKPSGALSMGVDANAKSIFRITIGADTPVLYSSVDPRGRPILSFWLLFHHPVGWWRDAWLLMKESK